MSRSESASTSRNDATCSHLARHKPDVNYAESFSTASIQIKQLYVPIHDGETPIRSYVGPAPKWKVRLGVLITVVVRFNTLQKDPPVQTSWRLIETTLPSALTDDGLYCFGRPLDGGESSKSVICPSRTMYIFGLNDWSDPR